MTFLGVFGVRVTGNTRKTMRPILRPFGMCDLTGVGIEKDEKLPYVTKRVLHAVFRPFAV